MSNVHFLEDVQMDDAEYPMTPGASSPFAMAGNSPMSPDTPNLNMTRGSCPETPYKGSTPNRLSCSPDYSFRTQPWPPACPPSVSKKNSFPPETPARLRLTRTDSLVHPKLLLTTPLKRQPSEFLFDNHFDFVELIGSGSFSEVWRIQSYTDGKYYAGKKSKNAFKGRGDRRRYLHEVESVASLPEHQNIVKYYRAWQQEAHFYVQMELCEGGNLKANLKAHQSPLTEQKIWTFMYEVANGLSFLHRNNVLHLDIKPDNIFIGSDGHLKIGDFGQAVVGEKWEHEEGDCQYLAPEVLDNEVTAAADMFSFGAMIYEWVTRKDLPCNGQEWHDLRSGKVALPPTCSAELSNVIRNLLQRDPAKRSTADEILGHPYVHLVAKQQLSSFAHQHHQPFGHVA
eukprot:GFYU01001815.1.p1 GENE.GFYU01001815.1~~GFYU01001815.1.p1  ORF type:complete len:398 (+),score=106.74 GFYU01001815.1:102-1295(+)